MNMQERIEMLEDAQRLLEQARGLIKAAAKDTSYENWTEAYIEAQLEILELGPKSQYMTRDASVDGLIEMLAPGRNKT